MTKSTTSGWFGKLKPLVAPEEEEGGYLGEYLGKSEDWDDDTRKSSLSSMWSRIRRKKTDPQEVVLALLNIREVVSNLLKIHGMPKGTTISVALLGQMAKGVSGFGSLDKGKRHFEEPYLYLDKEVYSQYGAEEILDIYCGIGIHEAEHLNETRELYLKMLDGEVEVGTIECIWEGLFEDERIEESARKRSPGYAPYLHAMKRAIFEKKEFGSSQKTWKTLPDLDKIRSIIFGFIRCPYSLTDNQKIWETLGGECVFDTLRHEYDHIPRTEKEVGDYARRLMIHWKRWEAEYEDLLSKTSSEVTREIMKASIMEDAPKPPSPPGSPPPEPSQELQYDCPEDKLSAVVDALTKAGVPFEDLEDSDARDTYPF